MRTIKFDGKDSWDWYELLTLSIQTTEPEMKEYKVDIAGRNGDLDMSEAIAGYPVYYNRALQFKFRAVGDNCQKLRSEFVSDIHGKKKNIEVEDEEHLYYGRCKVTIEKNEGYYLDLSVDVDAEPYKTSSLGAKVFTKTVFGDDYIDVVNAGDSHAVPIIEVPKEMNVSFGGVNMVCVRGRNTALFSIPPAPYDQRIYVNGKGTIKVEIEEGFLV